MRDANKLYFFHFSKLLFFNIGNAEALPILGVRCDRCVCERERERERERQRERERERERERDRSDVTIVALKLAMSLHFP